MGAGGASGRSGQAADVELLLVLDDVEEDEAAGAAAVDVEDDDELEAGFEAGVLLDEAPRLSFR
ncbi:hypothetical protein Slala04_14490 [Streptomyces lavendulae subsp. lavendulae]|nr:hypothetical protein Slala04_14490 [Streptomyces lavendulae subsp. lavendulae]